MPYPTGKTIPRSLGGAGGGNGRAVTSSFLIAALAGSSPAIRHLDIVVIFETFNRSTLPLENLKNARMTHLEESQSVCWTFSDSKNSKRTLSNSYASTSRTRSCSSSLSIISSSLNKKSTREKGSNGTRLPSSTTKIYST